MSTLAADADEVTRTFVGFARVLRAAGVAATPDRLHQAVSAVAHLDVARRQDVYWAGRLTLCSGPDDLDRYDRAFAAYFGGQTAPPLRSVPPIPVTRPVAVPGTERPAGEVADPEGLPASTASTLEVLRHRDLAAPHPGRAGGRPPADRAARPGRRDPGVAPAPAVVPGRRRPRPHGPLDAAPRRRAGPAGAAGAGGSGRGASC